MLLLLDWYSGKYRVMRGELIKYGQENEDYGW